MIPLLAMISVAQAEQAFSDLAAEQGQWAAFRATAAPDAVIYAPVRTPAGPALARLPDPPADQRLSWRAAHTITACDGTLAYSTGPWSRPDGKTGWFGTIWRNTVPGWRWILTDAHDGGPTADAGREEDDAACPGPAGSIKPPADTPGTAMPIDTIKTGAMASLIEGSDEPLPLAFTLGEADAQGGSADHSLVWRTNPILGGKPGAHLLRVWSWDGRRYRLAVLDASSGG